jgi:hypothetical protein
LSSKSRKLQRACPSSGVEQPMQSAGFLLAIKNRQHGSSRWFFAAQNRLKALFNQLLAEIVVLTAREEQSKILATASSAGQSQRDPSSRESLPRLQVGHDAVDGANVVRVANAAGRNIRV